MTFVRLLSASAFLSMAGCVCEGPNLMCFLSPAIDREAPTVEILSPEPDTPVLFAADLPLLLWVADDETLPENLEVSIYFDDEAIEEEVQPTEMGVVQHDIQAAIGEHSLLVIVVDERGGQTNSSLEFSVVATVEDTASR